MKFLKNWSAYGRGRVLVAAILYMVAMFMMGMDQLPLARQYGFDYIAPGQKTSAGQLCVIGFGQSFVLLVVTVVVWRLWRIANRA